MYYLSTIKQGTPYVNEFIFATGQHQEGQVHFLKSENVEGKASAHINFTKILFKNIYHIKNVFIKCIL
jgi:hypothetical protein